jgi:hypothetical protein
LPEQTVLFTAISLYNRALPGIVQTLMTQVLPYTLRLAKASFGEKKKTIIMEYFKIYWLHFVQGKACGM